MLGPHRESTDRISPLTKMYLMGIMDHFHNVPKMELIVWGLTVRRTASAALTVSRQLRNARSKAGNIKPGSTGPRIWVSLEFLGQLGGFVLLPLAYCTTIAYNGFRQPDWMREYALPSLPDAFGVDGVVAGRVFGLFVSHAGMVLTRTALETLGDQYATIGVSAISFRGLLGTYRRIASSLGYR